MTTERMIELLKTEHECMLRGSHDDCDRNCADCELVQDDDELHEMYTNVIGVLEEQNASAARWVGDTGHWIEGDRNGADPHIRTTGEMIDTFRCSWCGYYLYWKTPYCPNCGSRMNAEEDSDG